MTTGTLDARMPVYEPAVCALPRTFWKRSAGGLDLVRDFESAGGQLVVIGGESCGGTYVLRINVNKQLEMPFGRFKCGKVIKVESGQYAYVGSALSTVGATCLARRLVRHATRTGRRKPHSLRNMMLDVFPRLGLVNGHLSPPGCKTLRWNVDRLLDLNSVDLIGAYLIRCQQHIEFQVADLLEADPATVVFERGLGAADNHGGTHLLRVEADDEWWKSLPSRLQWLIRPL